MVVSQVASDVHHRAVASVGWYRWTQCALALLPAVFIAMSQANFVFAAAPLQYRYNFRYSFSLQ